MYLKFYILQIATLLCRLTVIQIYDKFNLFWYHPLHPSFVKIYYLKHKKNDMQALT